MRSFDLFREDAWFRTNGRRKLWGSCLTRVYLENRLDGVCACVCSCVRVCVGVSVKLLMMKGQLQT